MYSRKTSILVVMLFVLAAIVVYRVATREEPKRVRELTYKPVASGQLSVVGGEKIPPLNPPLIKGGAKGGVEKRPYSGVIRNPFQELYPPSPPPPVVLPKVVAALPPPAAFPVITSRGPSPAQIESGKIKFLGFLQREGDRRVFLSRDKEVFIVKKGDSVSIFRVSDITENSVTLLSRDSNEEFKLIIEDVKPTKPGLLPGGGRR